MSEKNVKAKMTLESLFAAQTHISQLDAENVLLRQLRVDLDSSSKDCTLLRRQVVTLEAELTKYRSNGTQIQPNMIGNAGQMWEAHNNNNPQSLRQSFQPLLDNTGRRADPTVRLEAPDEQDRDRGQRLSRHLTPSMVLRDNGSYQQEQQSVVKRSNGSNSNSSSNSSSSSGSSSGAPLSSFISPSAHLQRRASNIRGEGDFDTLSYPPSSAGAPVKDLDLDNRNVLLPLYPVQQSLSLADIVGIRRCSATSLDPSLIPNQSQRSSLGALISPPARSSSSSTGNRDEEQYRIEGAVSNTHLSNTMTIPSLQVSRRCNVHESGSYRGSGGGVSSFYDDLEPSAGPPIAPFGTSQSVLSSMAVYDETDRHLTALMTEKASLNEESSRLLQRGGKVLRERTRIQHIDARLEEICKEIAHERKKLSGKPG